MSALLSPINFADTLELWRALPSISFEEKGYKYEKYQR